MSNLPGSTSAPPLTIVNLILILLLYTKSFDSIASSVAGPKRKRLTHVIESDNEDDADVPISKLVSDPRASTSTRNLRQRFTHFIDPDINKDCIDAPTTPVTSEAWARTDNDRYRYKCRESLLNQTEPCSQGCVHSSLWLNAFETWHFRPDQLYCDKGAVRRVLAGAPSTGRTTCSVQFLRDQSIGIIVCL